MITHSNDGSPVIWSYEGYLSPGYNVTRQFLICLAAGEDGMKQSLQVYPRAQPVSECDRPEERGAGAFATRFRGGTPRRRRRSWI